MFTCIADTHRSSPEIVSCLPIESRNFVITGLSPIIIFIFVALILDAAAFGSVCLWRKCKLRVRSKTTIYHVKRLQIKRDVQCPLSCSTALLAVILALLHWALAGRSIASSFSTPAITLPVLCFNILNLLQDREDVRLASLLLLQVFVAALRQSHELLCTPNVAMACRTLLITRGTNIDLGQIYHGQTSWNLFSCSWRNFWLRPKQSTSC